jgi:hypothetical protein
MFVSMYQRRRRDQPLSEATVEHRRREDAAPRLHDAAPRLETLRLTFEDVQEEGRAQFPSYVRPVVIASAAAHFEVRCMEPKCDGRHDLTTEILAGVKKSLESFRGQSQCNGRVGDTNCTRTLAYTCEATYRS